MIGNGLDCNVICWLNLNVYDDVKLRCQYCINGNTSYDVSFALLLLCKVTQYGNNVRSQYCYWPN